MNKQEQEGRLNPIDIRKLFMNKNPGLARWMPNPVYTILKKIVHLDFINSFLERHGHERGLDFTEAVLKEFNISLEIKGADRLPPEGRYIFVSNHPMGGFDGIMLVDYLGKKYDKLNVLVNDLLMNLRTMDSIFVPINKHGKQSISAAREIGVLFSSSNQILTFPAGLVSRKKKGIIRDPEWKDNFIKKAIKYERDVIPIHVSGRCTNFFYFLARLRKKLGIKSNIEMFLLPDETYRHRNEHITITFGYPISWKAFDKKAKVSVWAKRVQDYVYTLNTEGVLPFSYNE